VRSRSNELLAEKAAREVATPRLGDLSSPEVVSNLLLLPPPLWERAQKALRGKNGKSLFALAEAASLKGLSDERSKEALEPGKIAPFFRLPPRH